jgi:hypothetical protein
MGVGRWVPWQVCALCTCTGEAGSEASHPGSVPDHGHLTGFKPGLMSRGAARLRAGASFSQFGAKKDGGKTQQEHRWQALASRCPLLPSWINAARARIHTRHVNQHHARWLVAVTCVVAWSYSRPFGKSGELCSGPRAACYRSRPGISDFVGWRFSLRLNDRCRGGRFPVEDAAITSPNSRTKTKRRRYRR